MDAHGCSCSHMDPRASPTCAAHRMIVDARGCSCSQMSPRAIRACAAHRMLVDARAEGALQCAHERFLPVQLTGCSWMLVEEVLSHGHMVDSNLCSAQDAHCGSWRGCSPIDAWAIPTCAAHRMPVNTRGGVPSHGLTSDSYMCSAQDARGRSWRGCSPMDA